MPFQGYLLKINSYIFPMNYIISNTYVSTPNQHIIDSNSYTDGNGRPHIQILPYKPTPIEFDIRMTYLSEKIHIQSFFPDRESVSVEYWNDETNTYVTGEFRVPDLSFKIFNTMDNDILYDELHIVLEEC